MRNTYHEDFERIEFDLLLEAIYRGYGYDFRDYGKAHIKRRLIHFQRINKLMSLSQVQDLILRDGKKFNELLSELSIKVTEMFRDPAFYSRLREKIIPLLKTYPFPKMWIAGCATGEEVYSMAILLQEEGLLKRTQIFATDFNSRAVEIAQKGYFAIDRIKHYTENYQKAGGKNSFSDYYIAHGSKVEIDPKLKQNVLFSTHNLVTDGVFGEMNMISCRNVLIYFNKDLQNRVINLFTNSLSKGGYLAFGMKESLMFSKEKILYNDIDPDLKIYQRKLTGKHN